MDERPCLRGCTFPEGDTVPAEYGAYLCSRCIRRLRHAIIEAPDLCAHLRSMIDPMKSGWNFTQPEPTYDGPTTKRPSSSSKPPMSADVVDAADEVLAILTYYAELFGDPMEYREHSFPAGADSVAAYYLARVPATFLVDRLPEIVADHRVDGFARAVLDASRDEEPEEEIEWSIAKAARRWPMHERDRWAREACPQCDTRMVRVRPPRVFGQPPLFWCVNESCAWEPEAHEQVLWADYFGLSWHVHDWVHLPEYGEEFRCGCGAAAVYVVPFAEPWITREAAA